MIIAIVVDERMAALVGGRNDRLVVVPRGRSRLDRRRGAWRAIRPEAILETLAGAPPPVIVLARPAPSDRGAACLGPVARLVGVDVLTIPPAERAAAWVIGVACRIAELGEGDPAHSLDVLSLGPDAVGVASRRDWDRSGFSVPALRPATLSRWAQCAWRACGWCRGGGLPGASCGRCGALVAATSPDGAG